MIPEVWMEVGTTQNIWLNNSMGLVSCVGVVAFEKSRCAYSDFSRLGLLLLEEL